AGSTESIRRAAREGYNLLLDQIAPVDVIIDRVRTFREECQSVGRGYDPMMVGVTRGLQIVHNDEERKRAILTRREVLRNIGDLARGPDAERYHHIKDDPDAFELDDAPLLGTPEEIIARLKRLEAGGIQSVLFAAPGAAIAGLRTFAEEIMPAFEASPKVMSSAPPSIRAMHRLPDLEASRAVTDHHASSCMTKNRAPGLQPAVPPVLADVVLAGAAGACGLVPA